MENTPWVPLDMYAKFTKCSYLLLPFCSSIWPIFTEVKMASSHCCLAKVMQLSSTCFPSHPGRLEMRGGAGLLPSLPWRLPPASTPGLLQSAEQGLQILCSHHPFSTAQLQEWESSNRGSGSLHRRETTLNPMSSKRRHELQCVLSVHLLGPSLLWDELHLEN